MDEKELAKLQTLALLAEDLAVACRVVLARDERNKANPESTPFDLLGWLTKVDTLKSIMAKHLAGEPLNKAEADFLNANIVADVAEKPVSDTQIEWDQLVDSKVDAGAERREAVVQVARENPVLHQRLVAEANNK